MSKSRTANRNRCFGINRNILECKFVQGRCISGAYFCINRNILECKLFMEQGTGKSITVLIETYWNVNYCFWILKYRRLTVLIETYWNVLHSRMD